MRFIIGEIGTNVISKWKNGIRNDIIKINSVRKRKRKLNPKKWILKSDSRNWMKFIKLIKRKRF